MVSNGVYSASDTDRDSPTLFLVRAGIQLWQRSSSGVGYDSTTLPEDADSVVRSCHLDLAQTLYPRSRVLERGLMLSATSTEVTWRRTYGHCGCSSSKDPRWLDQESYLCLSRMNESDLLCIIGCMVRTMFEASLSERG